MQDVAILQGAVWEKLLRAHVLRKGKESGSFIQQTFPGHLLTWPQHSWAFRRAIGLEFKCLHKEQRPEPE